MLEILLKQLNNYFEEKIITARFEIKDGVINNISSILPGQYFRIQDSIFNNGIYNSNANLKDESFWGKVSFLAIPPIVLQASETWQQEEDLKAKSNLSNNLFKAESFGGYSVTYRDDINDIPQNVWNAVKSYKKPIRGYL